MHAVACTICDHLCIYIYVYIYVVYCYYYYYHMIVVLDISVLVIISIINHIYLYIHRIYTVYVAVCYLLYTTHVFPHVLRSPKAATGTPFALGCCGTSAST